ncbi:MAG: CoA-binding protein [Chloroflexi bacterium]|nr:CoA-binding protein [Chloroflexota bacterium]
MSPQKALDVVFYPKSVAVIGASSDNEKEKLWWVGRLQTFGYKGKIFPINPRAAEILGFRAYPSVKAVPEEVDYAIFNVPAKLVPPLLAECQEKRVKIAHIFSAGFAETGLEERIKLQQELVELIKKGPTRVIGPNCMGTYCPASGMTFNINFSKELGNVGMASQSGAVLINLVPYANSRGIFFNKIVSFGNALDINAAELVDYYADDPQVKVVVTYNEGVQDGRAFLRAVQKCAKAKKPVIILKGGMTKGGMGASASHTGSLAGSAEIWKALFKQTGAMPVETFDELIEQIVAALYLPYSSGLKGRRVGILARGGGPGVVATDTIERAGLLVPALTAETRSHLAKLTPADAGSSIRNPVEIGIGAFGLSENFAEGIRRVAADPQIDMLMIVISAHAYAHMGVGANEMLKAADILIQTAKTLSKPVIPIWTAGGSVESIAQALKAREVCVKAGLPVFSSMENAAKAIDKLIRHYDYMDSHTLN